MTDSKISIDESPECDAADIDTVVANMSPGERAEFNAWCERLSADNLAYQMEHDDEGASW